MTKNQFKKPLMKCLRETYGAEYEASLIYTSVNNGAGHECLSFREKGADHVITIGTDSLFELYRNEGESFENLALKITGYYTAFTEAAKEASCGKLEKLASNIYCRLVNFEMNRQRLMNVPHEKRLDMAVVYYYRLSLSAGEHAGVVIDYAKFVDREKEEFIREAAWENTLRDEPPAFCLLSDLIGVMPGNEMPLYVITNSDRYYGAICIFYPGFMKKISDRIGSDLYILPSSIHECLVLPAGCVENSRNLREMVHTINRAELDRDEILSDSVYYYDRKKDRISIDI